VAVARGDREASRGFAFRLVRLGIETVKVLADYFVAPVALDPLAAEVPVGDVPWGSSR